MRNNDCYDKDLCRLWVCCVGAKLDMRAQLLVFGIICGGAAYVVSPAIMGHVHS